jgi:ribosomal protein S18 acetylase RimI-like enzyme
MMPLTTHPITIHSYRQAAEVLARAFVDDPVTVAVYRNFNPERRLRALRVDFTAELLECVHRGRPLQMEEDGRVVAAAVVYPPRTYPLPVLIQWLLLAKSIWGNGFYDIVGWMRWLEEVDKYRPSEPHYYLEYLGVEPDQQGKAVGSALVRSLTRIVDDTRVGCYLENANPRNNRFYQRLGFQIINEKEIIGVPTWFMWRPAVSS